jgi:hypothetical protein
VVVQNCYGRVLEALRGGQRIAPSASDRSGEELLCR